MSTSAPIHTIASERAGSAPPWRLQPNDKVASAGVGLAGRLSGTLSAYGLTYLIAEPAHPFIPGTLADAWQYGRYSARYGELPTSRHLLQLLRRAYGACRPDGEIWITDGRFIDAFRPDVQGRGFLSREELEADREQHLAAARRAFESADVFVLTLGDTRYWTRQPDDSAYLRPDPNQPAGGNGWTERHLEVAEVAADLQEFIARLRTVNPSVRVILSTAGRGPGRDENAATILRLAFEEFRNAPGVALLPVEGDADEEEATALGIAELVGVSERRAAPDPGAETESDLFAAQVDRAVAHLCDERVDSGTIKCIVWDLDGTLWDGTLLEGDDVRLRDGVLGVLSVLDSRGILHSIASRSDRDLALQRLTELGILDRFVVPQVGWMSKAESIQAIAGRLNFSLDAIAFIDDQPFERDAVSFAFPQVTCIDSSELHNLTVRPDLTPLHTSIDAASRRHYYHCETRREQACSTFDGTTEAFLATLGITLTIAPLDEQDLDRAEELMRRTHQFNSTARRYTRDEIEQLRGSPLHLVLIASMDDRYGPYGRIGLAVVDRGASAWTVKLLLMSCRVISRGVSGILLHYLVNRAGAEGVRLVVELVPTARNGVLQDILRTSGFTCRAQEASGLVLYELAPAHYRPYPRHVRLRTDRRLRTNA